jgi:ATP-binding cassette subfamily G (WHITE) protein 2
VDTIDSSEVVAVSSTYSRVRERAYTFSPWQPDNAPAVLTWKDIVVSTKTNPTKVLLNHISGTITGGFWAILGPSGGGKTTLLSTLSLRLDRNKMDVQGDIRLNGREYTLDALKAMSAYVMQDDLLFPELTVAETISYASKLRLSSISSEEQSFREDEVIELMGIAHCKATIIGDARNKGISGGERKRVCVAIELLTRPRLVFLDEPTSGLDSTTSLSVTSSLKRLSDDGICTVVCTIHQPQKRIFELFDNLILMKKGSIVYQGSCQKCVVFLSSVGYACPDGTNPADFILDLISSQGTVNKNRINIMREFT